MVDQDSGTYWARMPAFCCGTREQGRAPPAGSVGSAGPPGLGQRPPQQQTGSRHPNATRVSSRSRFGAGAPAPAVRKLVDTDARLQALWTKYDADVGRKRGTDMKNAPVTGSGDEQEGNDYYVIFDILALDGELRTQLDAPELQPHVLDPQVMRVAQHADVWRQRLANVHEMLIAETTRLELETTEFEHLFEIVLSTNDAHNMITFVADLASFKIGVLLYVEKWIKYARPELVQRFDALRARVEYLDARARRDFPGRADQLNLGQYDFAVSSRTTVRFAGPVLDRTKSHFSGRASKRAEREPETFEEFQKSLEFEKTRARSFRPGSSKSFGPGGEKERTRGSRHPPDAMRRTGTLRMMAALITSSTDAGGASLGAPPVGGPPKASPPLASNARATPNQTQAPNGTDAGHLQQHFSFSSALYATKNKRQESVKDMGASLVPSPVRGDGRCLFRSVAKGRALLTNRIAQWCEEMERRDADQLRALAVKEIRAHKELLSTFCVIEGDIDRYCRKMSSVRTFGGEPELLMLALIIHSPIAVYLRQGAGFRQIQVYGRQFDGRPVNILYVDSIHYDCLVPRFM
ncbi:OTU domain-containing protein [Porphyridium purpureum]|uniref:Ubiquitin thioesterase OTU n=1 Tax=Porphyridium purpureum TaxID=35688 RepID=A0A5J4YW28_PORPP|nr:OTU domain-containing protein [Porphyridium purpureum]|eukprot:POR9704..scf227_4